MVWKPTVLQTRSLLTYIENSQVYAECLNELREKHPGKYIAIKDKEVVLVKDSPEELNRVLERNYTFAERSSIFTEYVPNTSEVMII